MHSGLDRNGNGVLDDSEVEATQYACNASTTLLTRRDQLPPSVDCPAGGVAIETGIDANGDGTLEDAEIQQTVHTCNSTEIWEGDFTSTDWSDPIKVAALQGARVVTGSLVIAVNSPVSLPMLQLVTSGLTAQMQTPSISLPALVTVGGAMELDCPDVDELSALQQIGGALAIRSAGSQPAGSAIVAPVLHAIGGDVLLESRGTLAMPALATIGGSLQDSASLSARDLDALTSVGGTLAAFEDTLGDFSLPALQAIGGDLEAGGGIKSVGLPKLTLIGGALSIQGDLNNAAELTTLSLPALKRISAGVSIIEAPALVTLDLGTLDEVDGGGAFASIEISEAPALTTLSASALRIVTGVDSLDANSIGIVNTGLPELVLPSLATSAGGIAIIDNPALQRVLLPSLTDATSLEATSLRVPGVLDTVSAPTIRSLGTLSVGGNHTVHTLDFGSLTQVSVAINLAETSLDDLSGFHSLVSTRLLDVENDDRLRDLTGMTSLQQVSNLDLSQNAALTSLDGLDHVGEVSGFVSIQSNPVLASVAGLRNLSSVGENLSVSSGASLASIDWPSLRTVGTALSVGELPAVASLSFNSLTSVGSLSIGDIPLLTSLAGFDQLAPVAGDVSLSELPGVAPDEVSALFHRLKADAGD